ncbi:unnamed protein product [Closterium sp. NIES-54]
MGNCFSSVNDDDNCRIAARERRREARRKGELQSRGGGDAVSSKEKERRVAAYLAAEQQRDGQLARLTNRGTENGFVPRATLDTDFSSGENCTGSSSSSTDSSSDSSSTTSSGGGGGACGGALPSSISAFPFSLSLFLPGDPLSSPSSPSSTRAFFPLSFSRSSDHPPFPSSLGSPYLPMTPYLPIPPSPPFLPWQSFAGPASVLCAVMDGHGRFGHTVSARVRDSLPSQLSQRLFPHANCADATSPCDDASLCGDDGSVGVPHVAEQQWREAVRGAFEAVDREVKLHPAVDPLVSGSTAVVAMVQHDHLFLANLGDSRALLARRAHSPASCNATSPADVALCHAATSANAAGTIATGPTHHQHHQSDQPSCQAPVSCHAFEAVALTADHKCSDPTEAARIRKAGGRVEALEDEKHIMRIWLPNEMAPGLATSRAVGDFLLKGFGVTCEPDVTVLPVEDGDEFVILATDGVWDVLSHEEAVSIVATSPSPATSAERLVTSAQEAWATKYPKARRDDCTAVVLFLRTFLPNLIPNLPCPGSGEAFGAGEGGQCLATKAAANGLSGLTGSTRAEVNVACSSQEALKDISSSSSSTVPVVFDPLVEIHRISSSSGSGSRRNSNSSNSSRNSSSNSNSNRASSDDRCSSGVLSGESTVVDSGRRNNQSTGATTGTIVDTAVASTAATTAATATATATEAEAEKGTAGEGSMYSDAGSDAAEQRFTERHGDAVFTDEGLRFHRNDTVADLAALDWQDEQVLAKRALRRCQGEEEEGDKKNDKQLKRGLRRGD